MYLNISELSSGAKEKLEFALTCEKETTVEYLPDKEALGALEISGEALPVNGGITIEGRGSLPIRLYCDRCLAPVEIKLEFSFFEEIVNVLGDKTIDLSPFIKEGLISALPMKAVCSEDCKGLCPICGNNLNEGACDCKEDNIDPRFNALRSIFNVEQEV
ncbi:MAG: DUF177 domain-containing protein [Firmicutes bacterium]|nr:DUF177 domain-containing protein [Bacillota bacterium]